MHAKLVGNKPDTTAEIVEPTVGRPLIDEVKPGKCYNPSLSALSRRTKTNRCSSEPQTSKPRDWAVDRSDQYANQTTTNAVMMASPTISRNRRDEMAADQTTGISVANSRTAPSHPTHPRWSNAGTPVRHSVSADTRISAYSPQPPRRTASDKVSRQWQRHQLHRSTARECASSPQRTERRRDATLTSTTAAGREERGSLKSTHWKPAMKQVSDVRRGYCVQNACALYIMEYSHEPAEKHTWTSVAV